MVVGNSGFVFAVIANSLSPTLPSYELVLSFLVSSSSSANFTYWASFIAELRLEN